MAIGGVREEGLELGELTLLAVEGLDHGQVAHAEEGFFHAADRARDREDGVHDDEPGVRVGFESFHVVFQDDQGVGEGPVVQDHAEEVDVCAFEGLWGEEVVAPGADA